ncbi:MAG: cupin domain-containing protein [Polyangiaceae bacterium]|nr:cupin domain-containing protein [Polyangiaceae bacterium]
MRNKVDHTEVVNLDDPSLVVTAEITLQPGAAFPWHTHNGPVIVTVAEGELTYVEPDCVERVYGAGSLFIDTGRGVHTALNTFNGETVLIATFLNVGPTGPLTIPVTRTACGISTP